MELQTHYQEAISFAAEKHADQKMPGTRSSYLLHLSNVAMEVIIASWHTEGFDVSMAVQTALLHDVLEDTPTDIEDLRQQFGPVVTDAVQSLTKNEALPLEEQIPDSLERIRLQPKEVWAVKLADRISNMQKPPSHWDREKKMAYLEMAKVILDQLKGGNAYLEKRLEQKILQYPQFLDQD